MELVNATRMIAGYTLGLEPDGEERVVVAVKGTFRIPRTPGESPCLADEQAPLVAADEFYGEPGSSATRYESDYAPAKPRCDVLLIGSARAPGGRPVDRLTASVRVGSVSKAVSVVGRRVWERTLLSVTPTAPEPFVSMPIHYGVAYGGTDTDPADPARVRTYPANPVGVGYSPLTRSGALVGRPLPNVEAPRERVTSAQGSYRPVAFSPAGRNFPDRVKWAGTYDQKWIDETFPFLPADFDTRYFQAAPEDQQIDYPAGGEAVELENLTPGGGRTAFKLPETDLSVEFTDADYRRTTVRAVVDTIVLMPDEGRFVMVWRASHPLKRNMLEMRQAVIGGMSPAWYRARDLGKTYYPSLAALAAANAAAREE